MEDEDLSNFYEITTEYEVDASTPSIDSDNITWSFVQTVLHDLHEEDATMWVFKVSFALNECFLSSNYE